MFTQKKDLAVETEQLIKKLGMLLPVCLKLSTCPVVVSAGMPRSGSTFLYNMLREILKVRWQEDLSYCWIGDLLTNPKGKAYLLKTHNFGQLWRLRASHTFYSYRDVRTAAVSSLRKFNWEITLDSIRGRIAQYEIAKRSCDLCIKYEELIGNPEYFIRKLARILDIHVDATHIESTILSLEAPTPLGTYSKETQLHEGHFTYTQDDEWRAVIPNDLQEKINEEFSWWFTECGYPLQ